MNYKKYPCLAVDWITAKLGRVNSLKFILFETSSVCNYKCASCPHATKSVKTRPHFISVDLAEKIVREGRQAGATWFEPFWMGEPLLHPRLYQILNIVETYGGKLILASNASKFTDYDIIILGKYSNWSEFIISFNGYNRETYQACMGVDCFDIAVHNIKRFTKTNPHVPVSLSYIPQPGNNYDTQQIRKLFPNLKIVFREHHNWGGAVGDPLNLLRIKRPICHPLIHGMNIRSDGVVAFCCADFNANTAMGDVTKDSVGDIWRNMQHYRTEEMTNRIELGICAKCNFARVEVSGTRKPKNIPVHD